MDRNCRGHDWPEDVDHQREVTCGPKTYPYEVPHVYSPSSTFTVGMYAFRDLMPIVIEARHMHVVLWLLILVMCWFRHTCFEMGLLFASESTQHAAQCTQFVGC